MTVGMSLSRLGYSGSASDWFVFALFNPSAASAGESGMGSASVFSSLGAGMEESTDVVSTFSSDPISSVSSVMPGYVGCERESGGEAEGGFARWLFLCVLLFSHALGPQDAREGVVEKDNAPFLLLFPAYVVRVFTNSEKSRSPVPCSAKTLYYFLCCIM